MAGCFIAHDGDAVDCAAGSEVRPQFLGRGSVVHLPDVAGHEREGNYQETSTSYVCMLLNELTLMSRLSCLTLSGCLSALVVASC